MNGESKQGNESSECVESTQAIFLLPSDIRISEKYNVRLYGGSSGAHELKQVERLAESIENDGQIDSVVVTPVDAIETVGESDSKYVLVLGHRRCRAVALINEKRTANAQPLLRLRARVKETHNGDLLRAAIASNIQRRNLSAMDMAKLIKRLQEEFGWQGFQGAKKVAQYLGVNTATVTQHEKFLGADEMLQEKLHEGLISAQSALELLTLKPELRAEALERAKSLQDEERLEKVISNIDAGRTTEQQAIEEISEPLKRIKHPSVRKAIREVQKSNTEGSAKGAVVTRTRNEILEWFEQQDGPAAGYPNGAVRQFLQYFVDKWAKGEGTDKGLQQRWDEMVEKAPKGRPEAATCNASPAKKKAKRVTKKEAKK